MACLASLDGHAFGWFESVICFRGSCSRAVHSVAKAEADAGEEAVEERYGLTEVKFEDKDGYATLVEAIDFAVDTSACR